PGLQQQGMAQLQARIGELIGPQWQREGERLQVASIGRQFVEPALFLLLVQALFARRQLSFLYYPTHHPAKIRQVSPQRLYWYRDNWYLLGWCHERLGLRWFSLSRIADPIAQDNAACERDSGELDAIFANGYGIFGGGRVQQAELRFDPSAAPWVKDVQWHRDQIQTLEPSGHIHLTVPYTDQRELARDLLRFSGEVEVLAPPELRQRIVAALAAGLAKYQIPTAVAQPVSQ
ncbi:MAG: helix-turn-helix transcriptional regulator, partial [Aeromonas sp.]